MTCWLTERSRIVACLAFNLSKFIHAMWLLNTLHWLQLKYLTLVYHAVIEPGPLYFEAVITPYTPIRLHHSASSCPLAVPFLWAPGSCSSQTWLFSALSLETGKTFVNQSGRPVYCLSSKNTEQLMSRFLLIEKHTLLSIYLTGLETCTFMVALT